MATSWYKFRMCALFVLGLAQVALSGALISLHRQREDPIIRKNAVCKYNCSDGLCSSEVNVTTLQLIPNTTTSVPPSRLVGFNTIQALAIASLVSAAMELVIIITLIFNSECCRKSFHMACGIISISVSEGIDIAVTILIAQATVESSEFSLESDFWVAVAADACSLLVGILLPLTINEKYE